MERIQRLLPEANLVKAFNSVGNALMYKPILKG
jgi:predicted dinucleotide-binding enzyme